MTTKTRFVIALLASILPMVLGLIQILEGYRHLGYIPAITAIGLLILGLFIILIWENEDLKKLKGNVRYFFMKLGTGREGSKVFIETMFVDHQGALTCYEKLVRESGYKEETDADSVVENPHIEEMANMQLKHEEALRILEDQIAELGRENNRITGTVNAYRQIERGRGADMGKFARRVNVNIEEFLATLIDSTSMVDNQGRLNRGFVKDPFYKELLVTLDSRITDLASKAFNMSVE